MVEVETDNTDAQLVREAVRGERRAFDRLVHRHFGSTYAVAYARLGHREAAEDLAQEVFLRAFLNLNQLRDGSAFAAWVHQLTRNLAMDWLRRGQRRGRLATMVPMEDSVEEVADETVSDVRDKLAGDEEAIAVRNALAELSPDARELVLLHFAEELSQREIARRLEVDHATVRRRLEKATSVLRGQLTGTLQRSLHPLQPRRAATVRTVALVAAASALSGTTKAALVAEAKRTAVSAGTSAGVKAGSASMAFLRSSLLKNTTTIMTTGAKTMGMGKIVAGGIALAGLAAGYYYHNQNDALRSPVASAKPMGGTAVARGEVFRDVNDYQFGSLIQTEIPYGKALHIKYPENGFRRTDGYFTANADGTLGIEFLMNGKTVTALLGKPEPGAPKVPLDFHVSYGVPPSPGPGSYTQGYMEAVAIQKGANGLQVSMETGTSKDFAAKCEPMQEAERQKKLSHGQFERAQFQIAKDMDFLPKDPDLRSRTIAFVDTVPR